MLATKYTEYADKYKVKEIYTKVYKKKLKDKWNRWQYETAPFMLRDGDGYLINYEGTVNGTLFGAEEIKGDYGYGVRPVIRIKLK